MTASPCVTAVVVSFNGEALLPRCLDSLEGEALIDRVIVVDNASHDRSCVVAGQRRRCEVIAAGANLGFGRANNLALARLLPRPPEFILLLNQDAWLLPGCLERLVATARRSPRHGILSPVHLASDERDLDALFAIHFASSPRATPPEDLLLRPEACPAVCDLPFVNAAIWLLRGTLLADIGGFDPLFPHYGEDNDYCDRVRQHEWRIGVVPIARAVHARISPPSLEKKPVLRRLANAGRRIFVQWTIDLRRSEGTGWDRIKSWLELVPHPLQRAARRRSLRDATAWSIAFTRTVVNLPRVFHHRRLVRRKGAHFLSGSA